MKELNRIGSVEFESSSDSTYSYNRSDVTKLRVHSHSNSKEMAKRLIKLITVDACVCHFIQNIYHRMTLVWSINQLDARLNSKKATQTKKKRTKENGHFKIKSNKIKISSLDCYCVWFHFIVFYLNFIR